MAIDERTRLLDPPLKTVNVVDWDSPEDTENPKNWRAYRKWTCVFIVASYALMGPVSSSMVVPALPEITRDLSISSEIESQLVMSIFVLGWGLGPLLLAPLSELYGRALMLNCGHASFLIANTLCAFNKSKWQFIVLRFIAGFVGSAPLSLGAGVLSDLWGTEERGRSLAIYTLVPLLGPTIGPTAGGYIIQNYSWRWIFMGCSAFTAFFLVLGLIFLHETFAPLLLKRRRSQLLAHRSQRSDKSIFFTTPWAAFVKLVRVDLARPFIMLGTQPIIQTVSLFMAYLFGLNFLTISTFQTLWQETYSQSVSEGSLNYISISLGFVIGCQIAGPLNDMIYARCKKRNGGIGVPEFRTWLMIPASVLVPIGQLWYGWSAETKQHWIMPNIGVCIYSFGLIVGYQCIQAYVLDCYPVYAASAVGSLTVLRSIAGCVFPLFAPALYRNLGYGWTSTILAGFAVTIGGAAPWLLQSKGPELRAKSPYASGDAIIEDGGNASIYDEVV